MAYLEAGTTATADPYLGVPRSRNKRQQQILRMTNKEQATAVQQAGPLRDDMQERERTATATVSAAVLEFDFAGVHRGSGIFELEGTHGVDDDLRDGYVAIPLVVSGDDEPRGMLFAGGRDKVVVGLLVLRPEETLFEVGESQFPMFARIVEAGLEAVLLLLVGDMEEKLEDDDIVVDEHGFEIVDVFEEAADFLWRDDLVNTRG